MEAGAAAATENVAILFTDIVGSTELSQTLSPSAADEVRRRHFSILHHTIADTGGTEVKNLGDGVMAVFSSASAALDCGVVMQQRVERDNRRREQVVGLRVGLSGGEVSREDDDYFGDPVVEAARLCAQCESSQILAADVVRAMAGRRSRHECRSLGELELKGLPDPVATVEVRWEPFRGTEAGEGIPLPGRLSLRPPVGVVGRQIEEAVITDTLKQVGKGEGRQIVLVSGEAGLGKTTLVAETARSAFESGACVLFGHCEEDLSTPYQLFAEALGHFVAHAPEEQLVAHVESHGSELFRLVPSLANRIPDLPPSRATDSDTERFLLFDAVVGLLSSVGVDQPVVLVLDDLQWADRGSLLVLRHLANSDVPMRLLVVGTYRETELAHAHALVETLAALRRQEGVTRIELGGLDDTGVAALMEAAAGYELEGEAVGLAHAIYRETDGNPFFVIEVLRNLVETGSIRQNSEGRWEPMSTLDLTALPNSVREVIAARVLRLGPDAGRVLGVASVIGRDFDLDLLSRATAVSEDELLDILEAAAAVALVRELTGVTGRYNFAHALIQHTLYQDMGPNRRARAHRQVAEALEDLCGDHTESRVGELARHWISATQPIDLTKAIAYSKQAGDAALAALAPADALHHYAQAVDLYSQTPDPDPVLAVDLTIGLGTAQRQMGDPVFRDTLLDAARRAAAIDDTDRLVSAAVANDRGFFSIAGAIDSDKIEILEVALGRLAPDRPERALVLASLASELTYGSPLERRRALADEAVAIAESSGDDATVVWVLNHVYVPLLVPQLVEASLDRTADALIRAERSGDPVLKFFAAGFRACTATYLGDVEETNRQLESLPVWAGQLDQLSLKWVSAWVRGGQAQIAGDIDEAERLATEALQLGTDCGEPDAANFFGAQLMIVNFERGTLGEMVPLMEQIRQDTPGLAPSIEGLLALAHVEGDRHEDALRHLGGLAAKQFVLPLDPLGLAGMAACAEAVIQCRATDYAQPILDQLAPWPHLLTSSGGLVSLGPVSHYLGGLAGLLGRYDRANDYFAQAAEYNHRAGAKFFDSRTNLSWGQMLAERGAEGDADRSRDLLSRAQSAAAVHGYANVERRAAQALRDLD